MEKKWFVVYTRPQQELKVAEQLSAMGITNYSPTITLVKQYSDRKKKVSKPLLSSYVMVELEEKERNKVFDCSGIVRYLFFLSIGILFYKGYSGAVVCNSYSGELTSYF